MDTLKQNLSFLEIISKSGSGDGAIGHTEAKSYLRHKHPMIGIDRIEDHKFTEGWVHAIRSISSSHNVFAGHFEDLAIYPATTLLQDVVQVCILLFIGSTRPLKENEITVVSSMNTKIGHPIPPGSLLDICVWTEKLKNNHINISFEVRMKDFPFYEEKNKYGVDFSSALIGNIELYRLKKNFYEGIGL